MRLTERGFKQILCMRLTIFVLYNHVHLLTRVYSIVINFFLYINEFNITL